MAQADGPGQYVLTVLQQFPNNELTAADLFEYQGDDRRFNKAAIFNAVNHLLTTGRVVRTIEDRAAWWAISDAGLTGAGAGKARRSKTKVKAKPIIEEIAVTEAEGIVEAEPLEELTPPAADVVAAPSAEAAITPAKPPVRYPANRFRAVAIGNG